MPLISGVTGGGVLVPLLVDANGAPILAAGTNLIGRVDARGGNKLRSYAGRQAEEVVNLNAVAGL